MLPLCRLRECAQPRNWLHGNPSYSPDLAVRFRGGRWTVGFSVSPADPESQANDGDSAAPRLIVHVETHLGRITGGVRDPLEPRLRYASIHDAPTAGACSWVTLGLSDHLLHADAGRVFRLELLAAWYDRFAPLHPERLLAQVATGALATHRALLRGQTAGPFHSITPDSPLDTLYCSVPVYFRESLYTFAESVPPTAFVWVVPISRGEARYVSQFGWEAFEDLLVRQRPDLLDLHRPSIA